MVVWNGIVHELQRTNQTLDFLHVIPSTLLHLFLFHALCIQNARVLVLFQHLLLQLLLAFRMSLPHKPIPPIPTLAREIMRVLNSSGFFNAAFNLYSLSKLSFFVLIVLHESCNPSSFREDPDSDAQSAANAPCAPCLSQRSSRTTCQTVKRSSCGNQRLRNNRAHSPPNSESGHPRTESESGWAQQTEQENR